jgi:hypothetical protein
MLRMLRLRTSQHRKIFVISAGDRIFEESRHQPGSDPAPLPARLDGKGGFRAPASRIQRTQFSDTAHGSRRVNRKLLQLCA